MNEKIKNFLVFINKFMNNKKGINMTWTVIVVIIVLVLLLIIWLIATGKIGAWLSNLELV